MTHFRSRKETRIINESAFNVVLLEEPSDIIAGAISKVFKGHEVPVASTGGDWVKYTGKKNTKNYIAVHRFARQSDLETLSKDAPFSFQEYSKSMEDLFTSGTYPAGHKRERYYDVAIVRFPSKSAEVIRKDAGNEIVILFYTDLANDLGKVDGKKNHEMFNILECEAYNLGADALISLNSENAESLRDLAVLKAREKFASKKPKDVAIAR